MLAPMAVSQSDHQAEGVRWDLSGLAADPADARARADAAAAAAADFEQRWRPRLESLDGPSLAELLAELADLRSAREEATAYGYLAGSTDAGSTEAQDTEAYLEEKATAIGNAVRFFELSWLALTDERAAELAAAPEVAADSYYLTALRRFVPYSLSEAEERVLAEREATALKAWQAFHNRHVSTLSIDFDAGNGPEPHSVGRLDSYSGSADRDLRLRAGAAARTLVQPELDVLAQCYDAIVADRLIMDRLQGLPGPMSRTHLDNQLEPSAVDAMLDAIEGSYPVLRRWVRTKAALLGIEKLDFNDVQAPIGSPALTSWGDAREVCLAAFGRLSPKLEQICARFFEEGRIDAESRAGKRGGAFCWQPSPRTPGYLLLNYGGALRDVGTLAHELGHGVHFDLAAAQSIHSWECGLALVEIPSTFGELLLADELEQVADAETSRALAVQQLNGMVGSIHVQTIFTRYEQRAYALRAEGSILTPDRLAAIMREEFDKAFGDDLAFQNANPDWFWGRIPHFIGTRFYTHAYAFAFLVALIVHRRMKELPDFAQRYLAFLSAGGSLAPADLLAILEIDLADPGIWQVGLDEIERRVDALAA